MTDEIEEKKQTISVAYSTLNMKQGKGTIDAIESVKTISAKKPHAWFFDIICTPNQVDAARTNAAAVFGEITAENLEMAQNKIIVGITFTDKLLPAKTVMQRLSQQVPEEDLTVGMQQHFEAKRMFLWLGGQPQHPPFEEESDGNNGQE